MNKRTLFLIFTLIGLYSCQFKKEEKVARGKQEYSEVIKQDYELYKPNHDAKAVLILFGGFGQQPKDIRREFDILELARDKDIAVVLTNFKSKLWLEENEKQQLATSLQSIIEDNQLPPNNIFIGGFSSGGALSLLISDYIVGLKEFTINPKGVFAIDSPVDLAGVYAYCAKSIERKFSKPAIRESTYLLDMLNNDLGNPKESILPYVDNSVFTLITNNTSNLDKLTNTKIRFYAEPDVIWWQKNRMNNYDELNAFYIEKLSKSLKEKGFKNVEYIETSDKGYKANGERHPHSWSIVDKNDLINWMLSPYSKTN